MPQGTTAGWEVVGQAGDAEDLLRKVSAHKPGCRGVVDIRMPPNLTGGLQAAKKIRRTPGHRCPVASQYLEESYAPRPERRLGRRGRLPAEGPGR